MDTATKRGLVGSHHDPETGTTLVWLEMPARDAD
jgi:hypothetical protein